MDVRNIVFNRHQQEAHFNETKWQTKPVLREIYREFFSLIQSRLAQINGKPTVELRSGISSIKEVIPDCICTDCYERSGIDRVEDCYGLTFGNESIGNLILFDVFHHLQYPGDALDECFRVLVSNGRVVIFEPSISLMRWIVYGLCHKEPVGYFKKIVWHRPDTSPQRKQGTHDVEHPYYAAQGNAHRIFVWNEFAKQLKQWRVVEVKRKSAFSYVASGGFSGPQLYPDRRLNWMRCIDSMLDRIPSLFATRMLVVLEKR